MLQYEGAHREASTVPTCFEVIEIRQLTRGDFLDFLDDIAKNGNPIYKTER